MFTGLVQGLGQLARRNPDGSRLVIAAPQWAGAGFTTGESIAVNGVCLTVTASTDEGFAVDVSAETRALTTLATLAVGTAVNLERAMRMGDALGGHLVTGHVDGCADVVAIVSDGVGRRLVLRFAQTLSRYIARKGSLCVDGVSLTVNDIRGDQVAMMLVPHTLAVTTLGHLTVGATVNIEVDMIARYLERLMTREANGEW